MLRHSTLLTFSVYEIFVFYRFPNVLILSTSNISGTIDLAFVDRADIKQFIGLPTSRAIYAIYYSCLKELVRVSVLSFDPSSISLLFFFLLR